MSDNRFLKKRGYLFFVLPTAEMTSKINDILKNSVLLKLEFEADFRWFLSINYNVVQLDTFRPHLLSC